MDINFKNISFEELKKYKGNICLYSLNFESNLGDKVNNYFEELLTENNITYNNSLAQENDADLILIDSDDFNPSKLFGLTKKYENPIVLFISKEDKLEKLRSLLLRNVLIIDKNTVSKVDITNDVNKNIEEKRKKDEEKLQKLQETLVINNETFSLNENKDENNIFFIENNNEISIQPQPSIVIEINKPEVVFEEPKKEEIKIETKNIFKDNYKEENTFIPEKIDKIEEIEIEEEIVEESKKELNIINNITNLEINFENIAYYTHDIEIIQNLETFFGKSLYKINNLKEIQKYDILFIEITYSSIAKVYDFINEVGLCPLILLGNKQDKIDKIKALLKRDVLIIEKVSSLPKEEFYKKILEYLNNFSYEVNQSLQEITDEDIENDILRKRDERIVDNNYETEMKSSFYKYVDNVNTSKQKNNIKETEKETKKIDKESVKNAINEANKRQDRNLSLEYIYEKMGLNNIAIFNSNLNKCIFTMNNGQLIKYMPSGYLIEYRIRRLKKRGLSNEEINEALKKLEKSDLEFQVKMLKRIDSKGKPIINVATNYNEVILEKISYSETKNNKINKRNNNTNDNKNIENKGTKEENKFIKELEKIENNISKINFKIFNEFTDFILNYRKLKKEINDKKSFSKEVNLNECKPVKIKKEEKVGIIKKNQNIDEKENNINELTKNNIDNNDNTEKYDNKDITNEKEEKTSQFLEQTRFISKKRLSYIANMERSQTNKSYNNEDKNIKHRELDITLNELNQQLPGKTLLEEFDFYEIHNDNGNNKTEQNKTLFESYNVRPPRNQ